MGAAAPLAILGTGMAAGGEFLKARGQAEGYRHQEEKAQRAAMAARTAADETDTVLREELNTTLGNIAAIRAASGVTLDSPTGIAITDEESRVSDRQRRISVGNLTRQATQYESDARYYRSAAGSALLAGAVGAAGTAFRGLSGR